MQIRAPFSGPVVEEGEEEGEREEGQEEEEYPEEVRDLCLLLFSLLVIVTGIFNNERRFQMPRLEEVEGDAE